jgi:hypothetical protein
MERRREHKSGHSSSRPAGNTHFVPSCHGRATLITLGIAWCQYFEAKRCRKQQTTRHYEEPFCFLSVASSAAAAASVFFLRGPMRGLFRVFCPPLCASKNRQTPPSSRTYLLLVCDNFAFRRSSCRNSSPCSFQSWC